MLVALRSVDGLVFVIFQISLFAFETSRKCEVKNESFELIFLAQRMYFYIFIIFSFVFL